MWYYFQFTLSEQLWNGSFTGFPWPSLLPLYRPQNYVGICQLPTCPWKSYMLCMSVCMYLWEYVCLWWILDSGTIWHSHAPILKDAVIIQYQGLFTWYVLEPPKGYVFEHIKRLRILWRKTGRIISGYICLCAVGSFLMNWAFQLSQEHRI